MKHRIAKKKLNRTSAHHRAMLRNLTQNLIEHGQVRTTLPKAKQLQPFAERAITLALRTRQGSITARRQLHKMLSDRSYIPAEHQEDYENLSLAKREKTIRMRSGRRYRRTDPKGKLAFTAGSITYRLIETVAPAYEDRPGGYTRVVKLGSRRLGDGAPLAIVQFVGDEESPGAVAKPARSARRRRADSRYGLAIKLAKKGGGKGATAVAEPEAPAEQAAPEASQEDNMSES